MLTLKCNITDNFDRGHGSNSLAAFHVMNHPKPVKYTCDKEMVASECPINSMLPNVLRNMWEFIPRHEMSVSFDVNHDTCKTRTPYEIPP